MVFSGAIFWVFASWIAWVHVLSLLVLLGIPDAKPVAVPRPNVRFVDFDTPFSCSPVGDPNALEQILVQVSEPLTRDLEIPLKALRDTAIPSEHYDVDSDAAVVIKAGETVGHIRHRDGACDVLVRGKGVEASPRRFYLELQNTHDVVVAPDPQGRRQVELLPSGPKHKSPAGPLTPSEFTEEIVAVSERELVDQVFTMRAARRIEADSDIVIELWRGFGDYAKPLERFTVTMRQGADEVSFRLRDELSMDRLTELGLTDDEWPGPDEFYEFHADPRPTLIAKTDPCFMAVLVSDDDGRVTISQTMEDQRGRRVTRVMPDEPYWIVPELSQPLERDCEVMPLIDGQHVPPGGTIPAGERRGPRFGPFSVSSNHDKISISSNGTMPSNGLRFCPTCHGKGNACPDCKPHGACKSCNGRPGGCTACRAGAGGCRGCNGRPGGCLICGFGHGACGVCGGTAGSCAACGGSGPNGGSGHDGPIGPSNPRDVHVGPPIEGEFLLLLVNNQRLHEPGDGITASVVEAIRDQKAYRDAVIVVNEDGETELTRGAVPDPDVAFRPFQQKGDNLAGQVRRLTETIAAKRENAVNSTIPTVIVWPERELSSAPDLAMLADLATKGGGPISVLCPDAAPENARRLADALRAPAAGQNTVTVRSPKTPELAEHIRDVILAEPPRKDLRAGNDKK